MLKSRPFVLSIAGFDPSAGAGVLADVKTFEQCNVYGMGVVSALTIQNDIEFEKVEWLGLLKIVEQIEALEKRFQFDFIKIGLIKNLEILYELIIYLKSEMRDPKLIWDPVLSASAGFEFHSNIDKKLLEKIFRQLYLVTPNIPEVLSLGTYNDVDKNAGSISQFCNVFLKGGHSEEEKGTDVLYVKGKKQFLLQPETKEIYSKHGSGCVLSAAVTAGLANGLSLEEACARAKKYTADFLLSNNSLLGFHSNLITVEHE